MKRKKEEMEVMMMIDQENEGYAGFIKVANIHFNSLDKLAFKSNSFSCNLVRKLIPN